MTTAQIERTAFQARTGASESALEAGDYLELRAPFSLRCGAWLIDYILLTGIVATSTLVARSLGGGARSSGSAVEIFGMLFALAFLVLNFIVLAGWRGQTIGKWATGLRIERMDGERLSFGRTLLRHLIGYPISLLTFGFGFLLAAFNPRGRALHDVIAGTMVVQQTGRRGVVRSSRAGVR